VPDKYLVNRGDVLVSWSATIDVFEWAGDSALLNQHIFKVEFDQSKIDKDYFKIALKKTISDLSRFAHGSTMKHVVKKDFEGHQIPLPSIEDQIRIAHLLSKVEVLIAQRKQHLKQLDDLLKSVFLEIFGDPVRNEKGWEKKTAIDFAECIVPGRDKPKSFSGGTPWVTTGDLMHLGYTEKSRTGIGLSEYEIKEVRARVVPKSSVLMTCVGDLGVVSICNSDMFEPILDMGSEHLRNLYSAVSALP
jgi:type I restriction enzyme S subunit